MHQFKYVIQFLIPLITQPAQAWQYLVETDTDRSRPDQMQRNYYLPMLGFMSLVVFLCSAYHRVDTRMTFDVQYGMTEMVPLLVGYLVGPYVTVLLLRPLLVHWFDLPDPDHDRLHLFVFYSTSFLVALEMLVAIIPGIRFFSFIFIYLVYITFSGSESYVRVPHYKRWMFGIVSFLVIYFVPKLIIHLLQKMQG